MSQFTAPLWLAELDRPATRGLDSFLKYLTHEYP